MAVESLSSDSINIYGAETVLNFLMEEVEKKSSRLASAFLQKLTERLSNRMDANIRSLVLYLVDSHCLRQPSHFAFPPKKTIHQFASSLLLRLYPEEEIDTFATIDSEIISSVPTETMPGQSLQSRLQNSLDVLINLSNHNSDASANFKTDLQQFEKYGVRSSRLQNLLDALLSIPPTSTRTERNFSLASHIVSKTRSCLSDYNAHCIVFLKSYFLNKCN